MPVSFCWVVGLWILRLGLLGILRVILGLGFEESHFLSRGCRAGREWLGELLIRSFAG